MYHISSFEAYKEAYQKSIKTPASFWGDIAQNFTWQVDFKTVMSGDLKEGNVKWFEDGFLNITENCLDRHLEHHGEEIAYYWEGNEPGEEKKISYNALAREVNKFCNILSAQGVEKGDRVAIYLPLGFEAVISMLACARIGAVHSVVFAGFSSKALADRMEDAQCKVLISADAFFRGNKEIPLRSICEEALSFLSYPAQLLEFNRSGKADYNAFKGLILENLWESASEDFTAVKMNAEDPLFILYTSGSTGKPKGVVHTCGGYMVYTAYSFKNVFQYERGDVYWCTADVGWITGHSYMVYGPLLNGATSLLFEGTPTYPDGGRFWSLIEKYKVQQFYTAPTAIRALEALGNAYPEAYDLSSLKLLGTVGEPINEEAWRWYHEVIGKGSCPIVDTWWQTETGGIMISNMGDLWEGIPTKATYPLPGIHVALLDELGKEISDIEASGILVVKSPWPSVLRTTYGDHERYLNTYLRPYEGYYFTGDGAHRDVSGRYRITGRIDDVINVSGHRIGTAELEDVLDLNKAIVESIVVGKDHDIKGQCLVAFAVLYKGYEGNDELAQQLSREIVAKIGAFARPDAIYFVSGLPKTRSGKIMRRIMRKLANGDEQLGDISTLLNPEVISEIKMLQIL